MSQIPAWFVVVMGVGTVFVGLICIVLICSVLGLFFAKKDQTVNALRETAPAPAPDESEKGRILAAVSAAIAADSGSDPACVRIISIKKV